MFFKYSSSSNSESSYLLKARIETFYVLIAVCIFLSCSNQLEIEPPNVVIFIADDVSWDDFGCYGNTIVKTPNIDRLASNGIRFTNAYLTASSCSPSRNSIITGRYPHNTGAAELHTQPRVDMLSFPEILKGQKYHTVSAGKFHLGKYARRGFDKIFEGKSNGDGGENNWLTGIKERPKEQPFFMWFASIDAHRKWGPNDFSGSNNPENIVSPNYLVNDTETQTDLGKYYDEITRFDFHIGKVVAELKSQNVFNNTLIIIMADNGRPFPHSKTRVNDRGMKTPFIIHWPNKIEEKDQVSDALISAIDIAPTLLSLSNSPIDKQFQGHSFESLLLDPKADFRNYLFAEHNWHDYEAHERMVRSKEYLYILNGRPDLTLMGPADAIRSPSFHSLDSLYDTNNLTPTQSEIFLTPRPSEELYNCMVDPYQLNNIAQTSNSKSVLESLRNILNFWKQETGDDTPENLTKDWYIRDTGYKNAKFHGIREEMPGTKFNADKNNNKGPF